MKEVVELPNWTWPPLPVNVSPALFSSKTPPSPSISVPILRLLSTITLPNEPVDAAELLIFPTAVISPEVLSIKIAWTVEFNAEIWKFVLSSGVPIVQASAALALGALVLKIIFLCLLPPI